MATQVVIRYTCDICKTSVEPETGLSGTPRKVALPKDWGEVMGTDKRKTIDIQICPKCITAIKNDQVKVTNKT
jgi:hypothetical protein